MSWLSVMLLFMHSPRYYTELLNVITLSPIQQSGMQDKAHRLERKSIPADLSLLEQPTLASCVPLFLLSHFQTNECEILDFCL